MCSLRLLISLDNVGKNRLITDLINNLDIQLHVPHRPRVIINIGSYFHSEMKLSIVNQHEDNKID